jgi:CheY-like chemotaxis protein
MGKACLLIVEAHLDMLELMRLVLNEEGFYVAVAADRKKVIERCCQLNCLVPCLLRND